MAMPGDVIENPVSGEKIVFVETSSMTNGKYLSYDYYSKPEQPKAPRHFHPIATEEFEVVEGELSVHIGNEIRVLKKGEKIVIPPGVVHTGWNSGKSRMYVKSKISPAMAFEDYYTVAFRQACKGKVNKKGVPSLLQIAVLCEKTKNQLFAPYGVWFQKLFFSIAAPIGRMFGYKAS